MNTLSWQTGAIFVLLLLIVVAVAAQVVDEDRRARRRRLDTRRAMELARARSRMAAEHDDAEMARRISESADVLRRNCWQGPDAERLP